MRRYGLALILATMAVFAACSSGSEGGKKLTPVEVGTLWAEELAKLPPTEIGENMRLESLYQEYLVLGHCPDGPRIGRPQDVDNIWAIECGDEAWNLNEDTLEFIERDDEL